MQKNGNKSNWCLANWSSNKFQNCESGFSQIFWPIRISLFAKGQLISKCPFGVFKLTKKPTNFFLVYLLFFYSTSFKRLGQKSLQKFRCFFGRFTRHQKDISKSTDLYFCFSIRNHLWLVKKLWNCLLDSVSKI